MLSVLWRMTVSSGWVLLLRWWRTLWRSSLGDDETGPMDQLHITAAADVSVKPPRLRMAGPITKLQISVSKDQEQTLSSQGFTKVDGNLNSGTSGSTVFLWYKTGGNKPVTRVQFSFRSEMDGGLNASAFTKINKNINTGTKGDEVYLWYMNGDTKHDFPIVDLKVTTQVEDEPRLVRSGWERLGCDLNRNNGGDPVYLWVRSDTTTYIREVQASLSFSKDPNLFKEGYIRVDEDTNRGANPGSPVFLWYRRDMFQDDSISNIEVSITEEQVLQLQKMGYSKLDKNLNSGTNGGPVYLWYKHTEDPAVQFITVLVKDEAQKAYKEAKIGAMEENLNNGNNGDSLYVAYK